MLSRIIFKNGKEYLKISKNSWNNYLKITNPNSHEFDIKNSEKYCGLKEKYSNYCFTCNSEIGNWSNNCNFIINTINLNKYSYILNIKDKNDENDEIEENIETVIIEIDRNDNNNKTI